MLLMAAAVCVDDTNFDMLAQAASWLSFSVSPSYSMRGGGGGGGGRLRACWVFSCSLCALADLTCCLAVPLRRLDLRVRWRFHHPDPQEHAAACATSAGIPSVKPAPLLFAPLFWLLTLSLLTFIGSPLLYDD